MIEAMPAPCSSIQALPGHRYWPAVPNQQAEKVVAAHRAEKEKH